MNLGMVGLGYVGIVSAVGFAELGHTVYCHDIDENKMRLLSRRESPICEMGLEEKLREDALFDKIHVETDIYELIKKADVIFIAVGTPSNPDGSANVRYVRSVVTAIGEAILRTEGPCEKTIVVKSTVPVGYTDETDEYLREMIKEKTDAGVSLAFCPEFLREGTALRDFLHPERVVIGAEEKKTAALVGSIFEKMAGTVPFVYTNRVSAEIIKYTANTMLAAKVALLNEVADYAETVGGKIEDISEAVGLDSRIGSKYLKASLGFGGTCLPKDVKAFSFLSESRGLELPIVQSIFRSNEKHILRQIGRICDAAKEQGAKSILVLGTAFKADTDDIRDSSAIKIILGLTKRGFTVTVSDPKALGNTRSALGDRVQYAEDFYSALSGADLVVIATDWKEYAALDVERLKTMKGKIVFDLRNVLDRARLEEIGFIYYGIAR